MKTKRVPLGVFFNKETIWKRIKAFGQIGKTLPKSFHNSRNYMMHDEKMPI